VVLTRCVADNARLREAIGSIDADVVDYPCLAIEPMPVAEAIADRLASGRYEGAVFASRNAAEHLLTGRTFAAPRHVVAIGPHTGRALERFGWPPTAIASEPNVQTAAEELGRLLPGAGAVLCVRGDIGSDLIVRALRGAGRDVDEAIVYRTIDAAAGPLPADDRATLVVFASPSAVRHFAVHNERTPHGAEALAIGPTTAAAAREAGWRTHLSAGPSAERLADAIRAWVG